MAGILPDPASGGVVTRDENGTCVAPANVQNGPCPPAEFTSTCNLTGLPSDCTARITPAQINAITSELVNFAACLNPDGVWDCTSLSNLCTNFTAWANENKLVDGVTIIGTGTLVDPWRVNPDGIVSAICADGSAKTALATCLVSGDEDNSVVVGSDGGLYVSPDAAVVTDGSTITGDGTDGDPLTVSPIGVVGAICADATARDAMAACTISASPGQALTLGADGGIYFDGEGNPLQTVNEICENNAAHDALAACLRSTDAPNSLILGSDGGLLVPPAASVIPPVAAVCAEPAFVRGANAAAGPELLFRWPGAMKSFNVTAAQPQLLLHGPLALDVIMQFESERRTYTVANPSPCRRMNLFLDVASNFALTQIGNGSMRTQVFYSLNGAAFAALGNASVYEEANRTNAERSVSGNAGNTHTSLNTFGDLAPGASISLAFFVRTNVTFGYSPGSFLSLAFNFRLFGTTE